MGLDEEIRNILELRQQVSAVDSEAYKKLEELRDRILGGESTGDLIRDFLIFNQGIPTKEDERPFRELETKLNEGIGSQILVVSQMETIHGCPGIVAPEYIDPMFLGIDTNLSLGVLTSGLRLNVKNNMVELPTDRHVKKSDRYLIRDKWELVEGPIEIHQRDFMDFGKEVKRRETPMSNDFSDGFKHGLQIYTEREVEGYFSGKGLLGNELDTSYVNALELLGLKAPEIFREKYDRKVHEKRIEIITQLDGLMAKEVRLSRRIESVYAQIDRRPMIGGRVLYETGPTIPGLDEEEARILSAGTREKLEETKRRIKILLGEALELKMHTSGLELEIKPGVTMNVPVYVSEMCKVYGVELPR